jgi:type II secretory pathway predicted ATPase ExeA
MEYQYIKAMQEFDLSYGELPEDAQTGIDQIKDVEKAISMLSNRGKNPTEKTMKKLRAMDKWVYYEILDYVNDTEKNDDEIPHEADDIVAEIKSDSTEVKATADPKGLKIEEELTALFKQGKKAMSIDDIESLAPTTYQVLYDVYDADEENGVETSQFKLIEKPDNLFHLSKN